jgi:hypothetical protein
MVYTSYLRYFFESVIITPLSYIRHMPHRILPIAHFDSQMQLGHYVSDCSAFSVTFHHNIDSHWFRF